MSWGKCWVEENRKNNLKVFLKHLGSTSQAREIFPYFWNVSVLLWPTIAATVHLILMGSYKCGWTIIIFSYWLICEGLGSQWSDRNLIAGLKVRKWIPYTLMNCFIFSNSNFCVPNTDKHQLSFFNEYIIQISIITSITYLSLACQQSFIVILQLELEWELVLLNIEYTLTFMIDKNTEKKLT